MPTLNSSTDGVDFVDNFMELSPMMLDSQATQTARLSWNRAVIAAVMLAAAVFTGCGKTSAGGGAGARGGAPPAMPVQVTVAHEENIPDTTEYLSILI